VGVAHSAQELSYGLDDGGLIPGGCLGIFLFATTSRKALGPTQTPIKREPGFLSPGVKRSGSEADYTPPSSAVVKNVWSYTSTLPYVFMAW